MAKVYYLDERFIIFMIFHVKCVNSTYWHNIIIEWHIFTCFKNILSHIMTGWFLHYVQSRDSEDEVLPEEDENDENLYENVDQSAKQQSTPKRQFNRWETVASI